MNAIASNARHFVAPAVMWSARGKLRPGHYPPTC